MRHDPARTDAIPAVLDGAALHFLRLDEVVFFANDRVGLEPVGNIEQHAIPHEGREKRAFNKAGIGGRARSNHGQDFVVVAPRVGNMDKLHFYIGVLFLEHLDRVPDTLLFFSLAPARERDSNLLSRGGYSRGLSCPLGCLFNRCRRGPASSQPRPDGSPGRQG